MLLAQGSFFALAEEGDDDIAPAAGLSSSLSWLLTPVVSAPDPLISFC